MVDCGDDWYVWLSCWTVECAMEVDAEEAEFLGLHFLCFYVADTSRKIVRDFNSMLTKSL